MQLSDLKELLQDVYDSSTIRVGEADVVFCAGDGEIYSVDSIVSEMNHMNRKIIVYLSGEPYEGSVYDAEATVDEGPRSEEGCATA